MITAGIPAGVKGDASKRLSAPQKGADRRKLTSEHTRPKDRVKNMVKAILGLQKTARGWQDPQLAKILQGRTESGEVSSVER